MEAACAFGVSLCRPCDFRSAVYRANMVVQSSDDGDDLDDAELLASRSQVVSHVGAVLQSVAQKQQQQGRPRSNTVSGRRLL